jgi:cell division protein FtsN
MPKQILLILILLTVTGAAFAQSSKQKKRKAETDQQRPNSLSPNTPKKDYAPKKSKKGLSSGPTYESDDEYKKRMQATVKQKMKNERLMEDPQYSDPSYFGHKRPPKRHKPSKMKFCKECGIRH